MARQLIGKEYSDMDEEYRNRISENIFEDRRNDQTFAGDRIAEVGLDKFKNEAFNVDSLGDFNFGAVGAGGAAGKGSSGLNDDDPNNNVYGRGRERFSKFDAKGLLSAVDEDGNKKFTAQELYDYGMANDGKNDFVFGAGTQRYLKNLLDDEPGGGNPGGGNPGGGNPGGDNPPPVNPNPPPSVDVGDGGIYKGGNYQYFNNIGGDIKRSFNDNSGTINVNNGVENAVINDNSRIYGGNSNSFTYNGGGGGNMLGDPYDVDPQTPTDYDVPPQSQYFLDDWKRHFMARSQFGG